MTQGLVEVSDLARLASSPGLLVGVDFDGTISELVDDPDEAVAIGGAVEVLTRLSTLPGTMVAVVSGRSLANLASREDWPASIQLVGSHGVELSDGIVLGLAPDAVRRRQIVLEGVTAIADETPGARVETKPYGVALHVRSVNDPVAAGAALRRADELGSSIEGVHRKAGKLVVELNVAKLSKASAIDALRCRLPGCPVLYLGDDLTDEDVFRSLIEGDVGVKVGDGDTAAALRVASPPEAVRLLVDLAERRARRSARAS